jgi:hypothetical protein
MNHICWAVCLLPTLATFARAAEPPSIDLRNSALLGSGDLQSLREPLTKIFAFKIDDGKLTIDREAWEQSAKGFHKANPDADDDFPGAQQALANNPEAAAQMKLAMAMSKLMRDSSGPKPAIISLFEELRKVSKNSGGGSGHGGTGDDAQWDASFGNEKLSGQIDASKKQERLVVRELNSPKQTLVLRTFDRQALLVQISNRDGDLISLRSAPSGRFSLVVIDKDTVFADQSDSFAEFVKQHRQLMETDLLPALAKLGVNPTKPTPSEN